MDFLKMMKQAKELQTKLADALQQAYRHDVAEGKDGLRSAVCVALHQLARGPSASFHR